MTESLVEKIADAVLYEGYILYPYRPSAVGIKNVSERSEIPALLVFDRRRPVGIKNVSLIQHGISNLFDQTFRHDGTLPSITISASSALLPADSCGKRLSR